MAEKKALTDESRFLRCSEIFQISDANCLGGREIQIEALIHMRFERTAQMTCSETALLPLF